MILKTSIEHIQKVESWINKEINIVIKQNEQLQRYDLARGEGYLSALKKVQAKIQGH